MVFQGKDLPLVYSCSGCSNNAQLTNDLALALNKEGLAEMSCIAGVGGGVNKLVKTAKSGRSIVALDGCQLHCVKQCLAQHKIEANLHYTLTDHGVKKAYNADYDKRDFDSIKADLCRDIKSLS